MDTLTVGAAKTTLSQRVARIAVGEEIVLARGKHPIARIAPSPPSVSVGARFCQPLAADELAAWDLSLT